MNRRLMMAQQAKKTLPANYTELEYITSDGTQWFDTGVYADGYTGARYKFLKKSQSYYDGYILSGSGFPAFPFLRLIRKGLTANRDKGIDIPYTYSLNTVYEIFTDENGDVFINDEFITSIGNVTVNNAYQSTVKMTSYYGELGSVTYGLRGNLYYCQIFQNGKIVRDFVPCINPEGMVGMYDLVEGNFYQSASTTDYVAGEVV